MLLKTLLLMVLLWFAPVRAAEAVLREGQRWVQTSYLDFIQGTLADGGANSYVAADGSVRLINQWDLNGDGFIDLVFPSTHDNNFAVDSFIYWGGERGFDYASKKSMLPGDGAVGVALADLNQDGLVDVVLANQFNGTKTELDSFIYWGSIDGYTARRQTLLPTHDATAVAVGDLNHDGFPELIFASGGRSYQFSKVAGDFTFRRPASDIYWGSATGYSTNSVSQLQTFGARDVKIVDLNKDGFPEILFAEQGEAGANGGVRIYWGTKQADYSEKRQQFMPDTGAVAVSAIDLNQDGLLEVLLANETRARRDGPFELAEDYPIASYIYWASEAGYSPERRTQLPTCGARDVQTADLNRDGFPDIIYANRIGGASYIYWGGQGPQGGYSPRRRTALPTLHASRSAVGDLNRDGWPDLVFSNEHDDKHHHVNSVIYWSAEGVFNASCKTELPTLGAMAVALNDLNDDGWADLFFANATDGTAGAPVDTYIYWGNRQGAYSPAARQVLQGHNLMGYSSADLNNDRAVDLVLVGKELRILWGRGLSKDHSLELPVHYGMSSRVADFNQDGYLDLSVADLTGSPETDGVAIYWGSPSGYSASHRLTLPWPSLRTHSIADLDANGYLDILVTAISEQLAIFWNGASGFAADRKTVLTSKLAVSADVADLNVDGYLDIIVCNIFDLAKVVPLAGAPKLSAMPPPYAGFAAGTDLYWGGPKGYSPQNRLVLPTVGSEDAAVSDLNGDGYLDLVISSYHAGDRRNHPSYVFWGSAQGPNSERVTLLPTESASGVLVADFNEDSWKDILFVCHTEGRNHRTDSFLYWGAKEGFSEKRRARLPSVGVHFMSLVDVGNITDRRDQFDYVSAPYDGGERAQYKTLSWTATTPFDTGVKFQVRFGESREALAKAGWVGPDGPETYFTRPASNLPRGSRWVQYKATLLSPNGANSPVLESVTIEQ